MEAAILIGEIPKRMYHNKDRLLGGLQGGPKGVMLAQPLGVNRLLRLLLAVRLMRLGPFLRPSLLLGLMSAQILDMALLHLLLLPNHKPM